MGFVTTKKLRIRRPSGLFTGKHINRIMKNVAENLSGLLFGKPAAALGQENETLDKVLRQWVPEIGKYPEQIARIRQYVSQDRPEFLATGQQKIKPTDLVRCLSESPPFLDLARVEELMLMLDGMVGAMEYYQLNSGGELTAFMEAHKKAFLSSLEKGGTELTEENDSKNNPGASRGRRKT